MSPVVFGEGDKGFKEKNLGIMGMEERNPGREGYTGSL